MSDLRDRFSTAIESVGGKAEYAQDVSHASTLIEALLAKAGAKKIAVSSSELTRRLSLASNQRTVMFTSELGNGEALEAIKDVEAGITDALGAVAETGTVVIVTQREVDRLVSALPPTHIVVMEGHRIVPSLEDVVPMLATSEARENRVVSFITGTSSTADIEQVLVRGVHGPQQLHVILVG